MKKTVKTLALTLSMALGGMGASTTTMAQVAQIKTQAPGFHRVMLGDFEITALSDGTVKLPVTKLLHDKPEKTSAQLKSNFLEDVVDTSVNAYLINTGTKLVLVDTGAAGLFGPTLGNVLSNLKAAGYSPEQVDHIVITHMHPDHVGGLMNEGKPAFPNASLHIDQKDVDYWLSKANMDAAPEDSKGFFQGAMASVNPYIAAGKLKPFQGNTDLLPGIKAISTYGHTPGHTIYTVESKGKKLVLWGDLMHVAAVQFNNPAVTIAFDTDSKAARAQREKAFDLAVKEGHLLAITHVSFPGMGHLVKIRNTKNYTWIPLNYQGLK